jgi:RNA-binding protein YhbY
MHPKMEAILAEAGLSEDAIDYIERRLQEEDLVTVPTGQVFLHIRLPWRRRKA